MHEHVSTVEDYNGENPSDLWVQKAVTDSFQTN